LSAIRARGILVHGRHDRIIPHLETTRIARAWPGGRAEAFILDGLGHVDQAKYGSRDLIKLFRVLFRVLRFRDEAIRRERD
jgi:pimeloyl-ACP methyl ester carboxylesterase